MAEKTAARPGDPLETVKSFAATRIGKRVLSGVVMIAVALGAAAAGGAVFAGLVAALSVVLVFEWTRMVEGREFSRGFVVLAVASAAATALAARGAYLPAYAVAALGGLLTLALDAPRSGLKALWPAAAAPYLIAPSVALIWLRAGPETGRELIFFLFAIVWATDTGAYVAGKTIRGPRFSPVISPGKTWAGLVGGALAGAVAAAAAGRLVFEADAPGFFLLFGISIALATELGDMVESALKRRFGVKDVSGFIPGHGGALDRLDGMIFATFATAIVVAAVSALQGA